MICLALAIAMQNEAPELTPAIYRCPAVESTSPRLKSLFDEEGFDALCVDPKTPGSVAKLLKGRAKIYMPAQVDTKPNLKWRNATIDFALGKTSPKKWLAQISGLRETIHFLTSPSTKDLRTVMSAVPVDPGGTYSARSVFAEMVLLSQPGRVCFASTDIWKTHEWPGPGRLESWILAMNDFLGPMLAYRHDYTGLVTGKPKIIRADAKPGLLIFSQATGKKTITVYLNNSMEPIELPPFEMGMMTMNGGLNVDGPKPLLLGGGYAFVEG
jgi:hypothetical protein